MRKIMSIFLVLIFLFFQNQVFANQQTEWLWSFEHDSVYELPHTWLFPQGKWQVFLDDKDISSKKILQSLPFEKKNNLAIGIASPEFSNLEMSAMIFFESNKGKAGILWGYENIHSYYSLIIDIDMQAIKFNHSSLGETKTLAKFQRESEQQMLNIEIMKGWNTLKIIHGQNKVIAQFNNHQLFESSALLKKGKVGIISLDNTVVRFDNITAKNIMNVK